MDETNDESNTAGPATSNGDMVSTAPRSAVTVDFADLQQWVEAHLVSEPVRLEDGSALYFVGVPGGGVREVRLEALNPKLPDFISGGLTFNEPDSMIEYLERFKKGGALVVADLGNRRFKAMLDYHEGNGVAGVTAPTVRPNQHSATLLTPYDEDYAAWRQVLGKEIPQAEFGIWFEDMLHTVYVPSDDELEALQGGKPVRAGIIDPGELLDMLNTINIQRNVEVSSVVNNRDGTIKMRYEEEDAADVLLPRDVLLTMPVFAGTVPVTLLAKLRYRVAQGGAVFFKWAIPGLPNIERNEFRKIGDDIAMTCSVPVLYGQTSG